MFLVKGEDLDAFLGGDGQRGVEHVDSVGLGGDVELVVLAEKFRL